VLVKGGDYRFETIVGSEIVQSNGGIVEVIPFLDGYSTSRLEAKIRRWDIDPS
jgi:D-glycero-beta-D-manno-heptose 1-phosphate adenylyltransferase